MIRLALPEAERARVSFLPVRDYYDQRRWVRVASAAIAAMDGNAQIALVGHFKDATIAYLRGFWGWALISTDRIPGVGGTQLRDALFAGDPAPPTTIAFIRAWAALRLMPALTADWQMLRAYHDAWKAAPYPPVFAVPGGFIEQRDTAYQSTLRELLGARELPEVRADDDARSVAWVPIDDIAAIEDRFHDDHFHMLDHFLALTREGLAA